MLELRKQVLVTTVTHQALKTISTCLAACLDQGHLDRSPRIFHLSTMSKESHEARLDVRQKDDSSNAGRIEQGIDEYIRKMRFNDDESDFSLSAFISEGLERYGELMNPLTVSAPPDARKKTAQAALGLTPDQLEALDSLWDAETHLKLRLFIDERPDVIFLPKGYQL